MDYSVLMKRARTFSLLLVLILALDTSSKAQSENAEAEPKSAGETTWYVSTIVSDRSSYRVTDLWSRGPSLRSETKVGVHPITTIVRGNRYWVYDELSNEGVEIARSKLATLADAKRGRPFGNDLEELVRLDGELVETVVVSGVEAETWRVTNATGRRTVWVSVGDPRLSIRVERFDRESGETAVLNYSNWSSGFEIPDGFFAPPAGIDFRRFEYEVYVAESVKGAVGPLPVLYPELLHGPRQR